MPTILRIDGYRFFFFSDEHLPKHIHIEKAECYLRIDFEKMIVTDCYRFSSKEMKKVYKYREELLGAWNEYFGKNQESGIS